MTKLSYVNDLHAKIMIIPKYIFFKSVIDNLIVIYSIKVEEFNMTEGVVESKEEMKKKMERIQKGKEKESPTKTEEAKTKLKATKAETEEKLKTTKAETEEKLRGAKADTEEKLRGAKADTEEKLEDVKEDTKEKWSDVKENLGDVKDETTSRLEEYQRESEKEGRNPAEKFLSDIVSGFRQKTEDVNQAMGERTGIPVTIPLTDIVEMNESITIMADLPGLSKENIEIGMTPNSVEITATYKEQPPLTNAKFIQKERGYGVVHRVIDLPAPIDLDNTKATYKNCTLTINLPKKQKELTRITIQE